MSHLSPDGLLRIPCQKLVHTSHNGIDRVEWTDQGGIRFRAGHEQHLADDIGEAVIVQGVQLILCRATAKWSAAEHAGASKQQACHEPALTGKCTLDDAAMQRLARQLLIIVALRHSQRVCHPKYVVQSL